ncbi:MAG: flavin reductase family protein [Chloroflexi bacterium]|nr:flavin reductase family protein [Chloroflexota bacterium]MBP8054404.1 flavin reductase family protein [Chloroflexota bacterium]
MPITSEAYRNALRHFPTGVTIVTLNTGSEIHGLTVSAFASVSPEPPLIMVVIDHKHKAHALLEQENTVFAVNILRQEQADLSNRFAWVKDEDRFAAGEWGTAVTGAPILKNALAWLDCTIHARMLVGTHTIYVGQVEASDVPDPDINPLVYWNRGYHSLVEQI